MTKPWWIGLATGIMLCALPPTVRGQAGLTAIKLLTHDAGWAARGGHLYWTTDFGQHWRDITPPGVTPNGLVTIANVFFLDTTRGWALLRGEPSRGYQDWSFSLASTQDAGATWTAAPVELPDWKPWEELGGGGALDFIDPTHGWMNLSLVSNSGVARGLLYRTADGGASWRVAAGGPPIAARVHFVTAEDGWLAGGAGSTDLYVTHDGGKSWAPVVIDAPAEVGRSTFTQYRLPVFTDAAHGSVVVSFMGSGLALFTTSDGGRSWKPETVRLDVPDSERLVAVVGSELITAARSGRSEISMEVRGRKGVVRSASGTITTNVGAVTQLSFNDSERGWVLVSSNGPGLPGQWVYATADGGRAWSEITPGPRPVRPPSSPPGATGTRVRVPPTALMPAGPLALAPAGKGGGGSGAPHTSTHLGFDTCQSPDTSVMGVWWYNSPYYDVGFYLGGVNTHCALSGEYPPPGYTNPTAAQWVNAVATYGWGLIPFWVGPQAPCTTGYAAYIGTDQTTARAQGAAEADSAAAAASASFGVGLLAGSIVYYDMEIYDQTNSACQAAVTAFIEGWDTEIVADGYAAGLYANSQPAEADWTDLPASERPSDIWVAWYNARATIWGLDYGLTGGLGDNTWAAGSRGKQYFNYPMNAPGGETYANVPLTCQASECIDRDIEYADLDGGNGTKPLSYQTPVDVDYPAATYGTYVFGINWAGNVAGFYSILNPNYPPPPAMWDYGFTGNPASGYSTIPTCGTSTNVLGVNDTSNPEYVGDYADSPGQGHGLYIPASGGCVNVDVNIPWTYPQGVNDNDWVVGPYADSNALYHGFIYVAHTGAIIYPLDYPGATQTVFWSINGLGQVLGTYTDSRNNAHPFIYEPLPYQPQTGTFITLSTSACKGQPDNEGTSINNNDLVALDCYFYDAVFDYAHSADITTISYPGSQVSRWPSINAKGLLGGTWADSKDIAHGFLATPKIQ